MKETVLDLIAALRARRSEIPACGADFLVLEKRYNHDRNNGLFIDDFILRIRPALKDGDRRRTIEAAATRPTDGHTLSVALCCGTMEEISAYIDDPATPADIESEFRDLSNHLRSWEDPRACDW